MTPERTAQLIAAYKADQNAIWSRAIPGFLAHALAERQAQWDRQRAAVGLEPSPVADGWNYGTFGEAAFEGKTLDQVNDGSVDMAGITAWLDQNGFTDFLAMGTRRIDRPSADVVNSPLLLLPYMTPEEREAYAHPLDAAPSGTQTTVTTPPVVDASTPTTVDLPSGTTVVKQDDATTVTVTVPATAATPAVTKSSKYGIAHALALIVHALKSAGFSVEHWIVGEWKRLT